MHSKLKIFKKGLYLHGSIPLNGEGDFLLKVCEELEAPSLLSYEGGDSLEQRINQIVELLNRDRIPFLSGYSAGGRVLLSILKSLTYSPKLVVFMGSALPLEDKEARAKRRLLDSQRALQIQSDFSQFLEDWYSANLWSLNSEEKQELIQRVKSDYQRSGKSNTNNYHRKKRVEDLALLFNSLSPGVFPTPQRYYSAEQSQVDFTSSQFLYLSGEHDQKYCKEGLRFKELIPQLRQEVIHGVGHKIHLTRTAQEQINHVIRGQY